MFGIENELSRQGCFFYRYKDKDYFNSVQYFCQIFFNFFTMSSPTYDFDSVSLLDISGYVPALVR